MTSTTIRLEPNEDMTVFTWNGEQIHIIQQQNKNKSVTIIKLGKRILHKRTTYV